MAAIFFWSGCFVAVAGFAIHTFFGTPRYIGAVLASNVQPVTVTLSYAAWHTASIAFFSYALALAYVALNPAAIALAFLVCFMNAASTLLFIMLGATGHRAAIRLPGGYLSILIAALTAAGIYSA